VRGPRRRRSAGRGPGGGRPTGPGAGQRPPRARPSRPRPTGTRCRRSARPRPRRRSSGSRAGRRPSRPGARCRRSGRARDGRCRSSRSSGPARLPRVRGGRLVGRRPRRLPGGRARRIRRGGVAPSRRVRSRRVSRERPRPARFASRGRRRFAGDVLAAPLRLRRSRIGLGGPGIGLRRSRIGLRGSRTGLGRSWIGLRRSRIGLGRSGIGLRGPRTRLRRSQIRLCRLGLLMRRFGFGSGRTGGRRVGRHDALLVSSGGRAAPLSRNVVQTTPPRGESEEPAAPTCGGLPHSRTPFGFFSVRGLLPVSTRVEMSYGSGRTSRGQVLQRPEGFGHRHRVPTCDLSRREAQRVQHPRSRTPL
jgi:hypothetical protein